MRHTHRFAVAALLLGLFAPLAQARAGSGPSTIDDGAKVPGAERLEGRLLAPCCWTQTLDIHGSDIATELRREIRARLKAGESGDAIEASLVARYGERIRAVPDGVPLDRMGGLGWLGVASAAAFVGVALWRWRQRGLSADRSGDNGTEPAAKREATPTEASEERLDSELKRFDDN